MGSWQANPFLSTHARLSALEVGIRLITPAIGYTAGSKLNNVAGARARHDKSQNCDPMGVGILYSKCRNFFTAIRIGFSRYIKTD